MAMLDVVSGGRLVAGFPVGTPMDTCYAYGLDPSSLRDRYHEAHDLIMRAWSERTPFAFNGAYTKLRSVNVWPRPLQQPHPPVWIPGGGSVETWEWCAEMDYVYCYLSYYGYKLARKQMQGFWTKVAENGLDPNPYRSGFTQFIGLADTDEEARELYREPAEYFFHRSLHVHGGYAEPPGYKTEATIRQGVASQVEMAAKNAERRPNPGSKAAIHSVDFDDMIERGWVLVGSPTTIAERLHAIATELNCGHMMLLMHFGNMSKELSMHNTKLFAEKVLPEIGDLFDDQWEDRWWPQGARNRASRRIAAGVGAASSDGGAA
jgi:alkanesulfonate monooxygenase SsuD/methylene tetrahydromethanopterin reductase-like flavin-dependent oxidoreductase (luciferase family)